MRLTIGAHMGMSHKRKGRREGSTEGEIHRVGCSTLGTSATQEREAGTFQAAQKKSKKSWNGNRTGTEIVRRVYRVMRRKREARELAPGPVCFPIHTWRAFVLCSGSTKTCSR